MILRRAIPRVATASLVLGSSTSCGGNGGGHTVESVSRQICQNLFDCDATYFYGFYSSIDECVYEYGYELGGEVDEARDEDGQDCADLVLRFVDCLGRELAASCDVDGSEALCEAAYADEAATACE